MFRSLFPKSVSYDQKRQTQRISCRYAVLCEMDKSAFNATVVDIGSRGLRMAVPRKLKAGTRLNVSYARKDLVGKSINFEVRWCRLKRFTSIIEVGGVYTSRLEGTWVESALNEMGLTELTAERRKSVRAPISEDFTLQVQIDTTLPGRVENLGIGGVCVVLGHPLGSGAILELLIGPYYHLKALKVKAQVVHQLSTPFPDTWSYGLAFHQLTAAQRTLLSSYVEQILKARADS